MFHLIAGHEYASVIPRIQCCIISPQATETVVFLVRSGLCPSGSGPRTRSDNPWLSRCRLSELVVPCKAASPIKNRNATASGSRVDNSGWLVKTMGASRQSSCEDLSAQSAQAP